MFHSVDLVKPYIFLPPGTKVEPVPDRLTSRVLKFLQIRPGNILARRKEEKNSG